MSLHISSAFDGGNIIVKAASDPRDIRLEIAKDHVRLTIQPRDLPDDPAALERVLAHFDSDEMLLFSTDYPHWQFDGDDAMPEGIAPALAQKICYDNPLAVYPRLKEALA